MSSVFDYKNPLDMRLGELGRGRGENMRRPRVIAKRVAIDAERHGFNRKMAKESQSDQSLG